MPLTRAELLVLTLGFACAQSPTGERASSEALATVNGRVLTEVDLALQPSQRAHPGAPGSRAAILDAVIDQELAAQRAAEQGLELGPAAREELARLEAAVVSARRRALANAWYAQLAERAAQVSEGEARAYFAAQRSQLGRQVRVAMVMRRSEAEALEVRQALKEGIHSSLSEPGWLPWVQLPPQWRPVVDTLAPGELSSVIQGDRGRYWIIELLEVREGPALTFEAARPAVQQLLAAERVQHARDDASARLRAGARVTILDKTDVSANAEGRDP